MLVAEPEVASTVPSSSYAQSGLVPWSFDLHGALLRRQVRGGEVPRAKARRQRQQRREEPGRVPPSATHGRSIEVG